VFKSRADTLEMCKQLKLFKQGDHSIDNVKFPVGLWYSSAELTQYRLLLNTFMDANMQLTINRLGHFSLTRFFCPTFP